MSQLPEENHINSSSFFFLLFLQIKQGSHFKDKNY